MTQWCLIQQTTDYYYPLWFKENPSRKSRNSTTPQTLSKSYLAENWNKIQLIWIGSWKLGYSDTIDHWLVITEWYQIQ